ncbi:MAG: threonine-phosphate decarboxylase CobD [Candidatus Bathyarchaeota archaeon]|nr:threonine-phosphate decarboxylase CobD [Candidatus Bathyarchaeota archaeon]
MNSAISMIREKNKNLKPCIHGGAVWEAASMAGFRREEILDFSSSVNPLGPSPNALEAMRGSFGQIASYPDSNSTQLRKVIANHFKGISGDNVIVGNGSTELIYLFAETFMERGDLALVPAPTFSEYERAVRKAEGRLKFVKLDSRFHVNPNAFARALKGSRVAFFCNPNNPTSVLTPAERLTAIVERALEENAFVFLDEDFLEFVDEGERFSLISKIRLYANLFVLRSFTKIFGLTGLRVGYGIASEEIISLMLDAKLPWNVNCLAQSAAVAALADEEHLKKTRELIRGEKAFLTHGLKRIKAFKVFPADANFILMDVRQSGYTAAQVAEKLLRKGILIRDCSSFRGLDEYYVRVAVKTRRENERLLEAFEEIVGENYGE